MARYFFHVRRGPGPEDLARDPDGDEIAGPSQVRDHALHMARDLHERTRLDSITDWFDCAFEITDAQGRAVMTVPFADIMLDEDGETNSR